MYRQLDATKIVDTAHKLSLRIEERFPGSGLSQVIRELLTIARQTEKNVAYLRRPLWPLRLAAAAFVVAVVVLLGVAAVVAYRGVLVSSSNLFGGLWDFLQGIESLINDIVFLGIAIWFLFTLESRVKRRRALRAIHELRSIAHIVDMHQLTKDPEHLLSGQPNTASSPVRNMTKENLGRYLDYCSEMLSLTSKLAALYAQNLADPVVLDTVSEVETLAMGLSSKIWQKITLVEPGRPQSPAL
jgi:hypothetical protein